MSRCSEKLPGFMVLVDYCRFNLMFCREIRILDEYHKTNACQKGLTI